MDQHGFHISCCVIRAYHHFTHMTGIPCQLVCQKFYTCFPAGGIRLGHRSIGGGDDVQMDLPASQKGLHIFQIVGHFAAVADREGTTAICHSGNKVSVIQMGMDIENLIRQKIIQTRLYQLMLS